MNARTSLSQRIAIHVERQAFADLVLLAELTHPHDATWCRINGVCLLREALAASAARIAADGRALTRRGRRTP